MAAESFEKKTISDAMLELDLLVMTHRRIFLTIEDPGKYMPLESADFSRICKYLMKSRKKWVEICRILLRHHPCAVSLLGFVRITTQLSIGEVLLGIVSLGQDRRSPLLN